MSWIFAFGSLMWRPNFKYKKKVHAVLNNYHRDFTVKSIIRWGSQKNPGATLGLEKGGSCHGLAYEVEDLPKTLAYLTSREGSGFHFPNIKIEILENGKNKVVEAITSMNKHNHSSYIGHLPLKTRAKMVNLAKGEAGTSKEYVENTRAHLIELGIQDAYVEDFFHLIE